MDETPRPLATLAQIVVLVAILLAAATEFRSPSQGNDDKLASAIAEDGLLSEAGGWPEMPAY